MKKIIFDTDPGIDDAMALQLIRSSPELDLLGITTVFGNAEVEDTTRNAFYLAQRMGIDAPIRKGAARPMVQTPAKPPEHIHGASGLGGFDIGDYTPPPIDPEPAHEFIVRMLRSYPGEVTLIAVAPLTNLALALQTAPDIAGLAQEVVIMGGGFGWGRRWGNVSPVAEANIYNDAHAADLVATAGWPVVMIGLDVTSDCVFTDAQAERLAKTNAAGDFLWRISRGYSAIYRQVDNLDGCCLHDVAAVVYALKPELFTLSHGPIRVATQGVAMGQTIQKMDGMSFPPGPWDGAPSQAAARTVDEGGVAALFIEAVERARWAGDA